MTTKVPIPERQRRVSEGLKLSHAWRKTAKKVAAEFKSGKGMLEIAFETGLNQEVVENMIRHILKPL